MIRSINFSPSNLLFWRIWNFLEPKCWGSTKAKNYVVKNKRNVLRNAFTCFGPLLTLNGLTCTFSESKCCVIIFAQKFNSWNQSFLRSWPVDVIWHCSTWFQGKGKNTKRRCQATRGFADVWETLESNLWCDLNGLWCNFAVIFIPLKPPLKQKQRR